MHSDALSQRGNFLTLFRPDQGWLTSGVHATSGIGKAGQGAEGRAEDWGEGTGEGVENRAADWTGEGDESDIWGGARY